MLKFFRMLRAKFFSDRGDSILVPAMIMLPVIALCLGMAVEVSKNNYIRTDRINAIQDAASSAVSLTNSKGSLDWKVVDKIVEEYEHNRFGGKKFGTNSTITSKYDDAVRETADSKVFNDSTTGSDSCLEGNGEKYPQYKITLDKNRGESTSSAKTVKFTRSQPSLQQIGVYPALSSTTVYRVVQVEIVDQAPNIFMGMAGMPCQKFTLSASAVTFGANSDLK